MLQLNEGMQTFQRRYIRDIITINDVSRLLEGIERYLDSYEVFKKIEIRNYSSIFLEIITD